MLCYKWLGEKVLHKSAYFRAFLRWLSEVNRAVWNVKAALLSFLLIQILINCFGALSFAEIAFAQELGSPEGSSEDASQGSVDADSDQEATSKDTSSQQTPASTPESGSGQTTDEPDLSLDSSKKNTEDYDLTSPSELQKFEESVSAAIQKGDFLTAQKLLSFALKQKVKTPVINFSIAKLLIIRGKFTRALKLLKTIENVIEIKAEVHYTKARLFMALQKWELALVEFSHAESIGYNSPVLEARALYSRAVSAFEAKKLTEARESFARALWTEKLSESEKDAALVYLERINSKRPWSFLVPAGLRYSGNLFKIGEGIENVNTFGQNAAWSFYLGLSATKIDPPQVNQPSTGHQIRVHIERPLSLDLAKLNSTLLDYSYIQSFVLLNLLQIRLQQFVGYFSPSAKQNFLRLGVESTWKTHLVGLGLDTDIQREGTPLDTLWLNALPQFVFTPGESDQIHIESYFLYRRPIQKSESALETLAVGIQPLYEFTLSPRTQIDIGIPLQARYIFPLNFNNEFSFGALLRLKQVFRSDLFSTFEASANGVLKGLGSASDPKFQARVVWAY